MSDTCFSKGVLTISTESDEIASMPEYKVRKQVSIMYVRMYVWRRYINVFVSCYYDSMYVCMNVNNYMSVPGSYKVMAVSG